MSKILAIDLGTTYFKTTLFDRGGRLCHTHRMASPVVATEPGRMELPADAFCNAIARGIAELRNLNENGLADVAAVTFATQTNSFVLLDTQDRPLTPIILWPDTRAKHLEHEVGQRCDIAGFPSTTGIPQVNHQFMLAKLLWLQEQAPAVWEQTGRLCLISDYLTLLLTGRHVTEAGAAGLTGLLDVHRCQWWADMLPRFVLDQRQLCTVVRAGTDVGPITAEAAQQFGLPPDCRFVVGCLDQYAGAIGAGNVEPGMVSETTGTVLATVRCAAQFIARPDPVVFQGPAFRPGLYWQMAFGDVSANYLEWFREQLPGRPGFEELAASAEPIEPGAEGLTLRTEVGLTTPEAVFDGLSSRHASGHMVRSIMEAVAAALGNQVASLCGDSRPSEIRCAGGAARSDLWLQIKADMLGVATAAMQCDEPTSLGAAVLAEAALRTADVADVARQWVRLKAVHQPDEAQRQRYETLRRRS